MPEFRWEMFLLGCAGGLLPDILRIIKSRHDGTMPAYLKSIMFYVGLLFLVLLGGAASWLLAATDLKQAIAYGFAAPEIISDLFGKSPDEDRGPVDSPPPPLTLRTWWGR
jgi:hypothetical protein